MRKGNRLFSPWVVLTAATLALVLGLGIVGYGQTATTTSVVVKTGSNNPSTYGENVTFTVTVYEDGSQIQTPSGTVSLYDNDVFVESKDLYTEASASVDFTLCFVWLGTHAIRADYSGFVGTGYEYEESSGSLDQVVDQGSTTVAVSDVEDYEGNPSTTAVFVGEPYTVIGDPGSVAPTYTDCGDAPTGTVTVSDGQGNTCAANLEADGSWECTMASDSRAVTQLTANYEGDENYIGNTGTYSLSVDPRNSEVSITGPVSACAGEAVTLTAQVTDATGVPGSPPFVGVVSWDDGTASGTFSPTCTVNASGTCSVTYTPHPDDAGAPVSITATYDVGDTDPNYEISAAATHSLSVTGRTVEINITCDRATIYINETTNITVTVTDVGCGEVTTPEGTVTLSLDEVGEQAGDFVQPASSTPSGGTLTFTGGKYRPTRNDQADDESHLIVATFEGSAGSDFEGMTATATFPLDVNKREVKVTLAPTVSAVFVDQVVPVPVVLEDDTPGVSDSPCCIVFSLPQDLEVVLDDLSSAGGFDSDPGGDFTDPGPVDYPCPGTGAPPWGIYSFGFYYKPTAGGTGTTTLQVTYPGNKLYKSASGSTTLTVETRPTATSVTCDPASVVVDQRSKMTIVVTDLGPSSSASWPEGVVYLSTSGEGYFYADGTFSGGEYTDTTAITQIALVEMDTDKGTVEVYYEAETTAAPREDHVLKADYVATGEPADPTTQVHEDSSGSASLTVNRRTITVTITSITPAELTYDPVDVMESLVSVKVEDTSDWDKSSPGGTLTFESPGDANAGGHLSYHDSDPYRDSISGDDTDELSVIWNAPDSSLSKLEADAYYVVDERTAAVHPVIVAFEPNDGKHMASGDGGQINIVTAAASFPEAGEFGDVPADSEGVISCGIVGGNAALTTTFEILNFANSLQAYKDILFFTDIGATILQLLPDVLVDVTDPAWSIIHGLIQAAQTDLDGDGIPSIMELAYVWDFGPEGPMTDFEGDTDGDGIGDLAEINLAGGVYVPTVLDSSCSWSRPNPTHPDSDRDGISDGDEYQTFLTNCCDADTDDDGLIDGIEVATWAAFTATGYESATLPSETTDVRMQLDPWVQDTDGDGIRDDVEYYMSGSCPYPNEPDSDGDGILDGIEDKNQDGCWGTHTGDTLPWDCVNCFTVGGYTTQATRTGDCASLDWETDLCDFDTDNDGLSDGEEEGLFGACSTTGISVAAPTGSETTVPALDSDMDDDFLDDEEEVNVYNTDPKNWDTDGDGVADSVEVATWDSTVFSRLKTNYSSLPSAISTDFDLIKDEPSSSDDPRDHADPNAADTDGDGLGDADELPYGCSGGSDGYVNSADSDEDGLPDGREPQPDVTAAADNDGELDVWRAIQGACSMTVGAQDSCPSMCDPDSDDDGLMDGEEFDIGTDPLDWDSDDDGLSDMEELRIYFTDPLNPDTDGDGAALVYGTDCTLIHRPTSVPLAGYSGATNATSITIYRYTIINNTPTYTEETSSVTYYGGPTPESDGVILGSDGIEAVSREGVFPFDDLGDQSDPLQKDTDGDGLGDEIEFKPGCNCSIDGVESGRDGYVNDDDSDNDGLQDGAEYDKFGADDVGEAGVSTLGNNGELYDDPVCSLCDPDSDGDGLLDGEEDQTGTDPLDWDSDEDGLSDREELQTYFTDPNNDDTDGDGAVLEYGTDCTLIHRPTSVPLAGYSGATNATSITIYRYTIINDTPTYTEETSSVEYYGGPTPGTDGVILGSDGIEAVSREGVFPFDDLGDQSDPLQKDTDGDGLGDEIEFKPGCNCSGDGVESGRDGYVNDDDSDNDGLQDGREVELFGTDDVLAANGNDGELYDDPVCSLCDPDSDGDGLLDGEEDQTGTEPLDWDSDDDGLSDREELQTYFTDPNEDDTDGDQADGNITARDPDVEPRLLGYVASPTKDPIHALSDCEEAFSGTSYPPFGNPLDETDPLQLDTDGDGLGDEVEFKVGCSCGTTNWPDCPTGFVYLEHNPYTQTYDPIKDGYANSFDSDGDGLRDDLDIGADVPDSDGNDGELYNDPIHSICDYDSDGDGLSDGEEYHTGTDWLDWDSDDDGLSDREELQTYFTDPNNDDTDGDQADGNITARVHTIEPTLLGHSGNGTIYALSDCEEAFSGTSYPPFGNPLDETDPLQLDTDGDGLGDEVEFKVGCSCGTTNWPDCPTGFVYLEHNPYNQTYDPIKDGYANSSDSDEDGLRDGEDVWEDLDPAEIAFPGKVFIRLGQTLLGNYLTSLTLREQQDDEIHSICDSDSDGDGLLDGEEFAIGTDWLDWDTDDDGRNDWHEHTGGEQVTSTDPIPTDPFDPDTDDDGLLDSAEVFGTNNTNPLNADTDGDGLCDGGTRTPYMTSGDPTINVNPICKSCSTPGISPCAPPYDRQGSPDGIGDHPNPYGYGEDKNGNGQWDGAIGAEWVSGDAGTPETDPNQYDTDGDGDGDGIEVLGFSTSRQYMIPPADIFGREITVEYPACGCLEPLIADTDQDGLEDGYEDRNHDGNFDFLPSEFDHQDPLPGPPIPYPTETNPCDPDTDHDEFTDWEERYQRQPLAAYPPLPPPLPIDNDGDGLFDEDPVDGIDNDFDGKTDEDPPEAPIELTFNPTNPLDHDTDNDWILDGPEVYWECVALAYWTLDNDTDGYIDEDPLDGIDNDGDGLIDEDPVDYWIRFVPMLDPTNRDSDSDGFIDGLDDDPCNSELIPLLAPVSAEPIDTDGDGFSDDDEIFAGTHPNDPEDHPAAYGAMNLDLDDCFDDRLWLEPSICCGIANSVVIDIDSDLLVDIRVQIVQPRDAKVGDFDGDGTEDDARYVIEYAFAMYRVVQHRIVVTIDDFDMDLVIDAVSLDQK